MGAGFLSAEVDPDGDRYSLTLTGSALAMASFLKPMPRDRAVRLLKCVIARAEACNTQLDKQ
jgi:hypothetical protein